MIGKERGRKQGTSLSQSGDLDGMRDEHTTKGESSYAENVVCTMTSSREQHPQQHIPAPHPILDTNYLSLSQGQEEEGEEEPRGKQVSPSSPSDSTVRSSWVTGFRPRDPRELVRNCSHINQTVKQVIVDTLARQLLQTENYIIIGHFQDGHDSTEVAQPSLVVMASPPCRLQKQTRGTLTSGNESGKDSCSNGTEAELKLCPNVGMQETGEHGSSTRSTTTLEEEARTETTVSLSRSGAGQLLHCLLYTSPSPRDATLSRMPSSA